MKENNEKSSISNASTYLEIGDFWDTQDTDAIWDQTEAVDIQVDIKSEVSYHAVEPSIASKIRKLAKSKGIASETLINLWLTEKLAAETA